MLGTRKRRWFRLVAGAVICAVVAPLVAGCGGGGGPPPPAGGSGGATVQTTSAAGTASVVEISDRPLTIRSAWQDQVPVGTDGTYSTVVSTEGAQLLIATDDRGLARGLTVSCPAVGARETPTPQVDVESTAVALVFLSPGILTTTPSEAQQRLSDIRNLSSFPALVSFLDARLHDQALAQLAEGAEGDALVRRTEECVNEWFLGTNPTRSRSVLTSGGKADFLVEVKDETDASKVRLDLVNYAWRYVNVFRRELAVDGSEKQVVSLADGLASMGGAIGASWGSLLTWTIGNPTRKSDQIDLRSGNVAGVEYWIRGPGWSSEADVAPDSLPGTDLDAWGMTIVGYLVLPFVDVLLGASSALSASGELVKAAWDSVKAGVDIGHVITATDAAAKGRALMNFAVGCLKLLLSGPVLVTYGVLSAKTVAALSVILGVTSAFMSGANFVIARWYLDSYPRTAMIEVADLPEPTPITGTGGQVEIAAYATGEWTGYVADVRVENQTSRRRTVEIYPGMSFRNVNPDNQDLTVTRRERVVLEPGDWDRIPVDGACINLHKSPPSEGDFLTPFVEQRKDLVAVCEAAEELRVSDSVMQDAVWAVTDGNTPDEWDAVVGLFVAAGLRPGDYAAFRSRSAGRANGLLPLSPPKHGSMSTLRTPRIGWSTRGPGDGDS